MVNFHGQNVGSDHNGRGTFERNPEPLDIFFDVGHRDERNEIKRAPARIKATIFAP